MPRRKRKAADDLPRLVSPRKLMKVGSSWLISVPPEWFKAHNIKPKTGGFVYVACDEDLTVFNPKDAADFRKFVDVRTLRARKRLMKQPRRRRG